jgi:hypothetical protein
MRGTQTTSRGGGTNSGRVAMALGLVLAVVLAGCISTRAKVGEAVTKGATAGKEAAGAIFGAFEAFGLALLNGPAEDAAKGVEVIGLAPWDEAAPAPSPASSPEKALPSPVAPSPASEARDPGARPEPAPAPAPAPVPAPPAEMPGESASLPPPALAYWTGGW